MNTNKKSRGHGRKIDLVHFFLQGKFILLVFRNIHSTSSSFLEEELHTFYYNYSGDYRDSIDLIGCNHLARGDYSGSTNFQNGRLAIC